MNDLVFVIQYNDKLICDYFIPGSYPHHLGGGYSWCPSCHQFKQYCEINGYDSIPEWVVIMDTSQKGLDDLEMSLIKKIEMFNK